MLRKNNDNVNTWAIIELNNFRSFDINAIFMQIDFEMKSRTNATF